MLLILKLTSSETGRSNFSYLFLDCILNAIGVMQEDTLAPFLFVNDTDYVIQTSTELMKENGLIAKKARSRRCLVETSMDADYADDLAHLDSTPAQVCCIAWNMHQRLLRELKR